MKVSSTLQPSFPFSVGEGAILALRQDFSLILDTPVFDAGIGEFEGKGAEFGDISFDWNAEDGQE